MTRSCRRLFTKATNSLLQRHPTAHTSPDSTSISLGNVLINCMSLLHHVEHLQLSSPWYIVRERIIFIPSGFIGKKEVPFVQLLSTARYFMGLTPVCMICWGYYNLHFSSSSGSTLTYNTRTLVHLLHVLRPKFKHQTYLVILLIELLFCIVLRDHLF